LGQAQAGLLSGPVGDYLSFKQSTAPDLVASQPAGTYQVAYFGISLFYFPSTAVIIQTFKAMRDAGVKSLLLAEWSLKVSRPAALTHLLAVLLQSVDPDPTGNVRTVLSPAAYINAAKQAEWELVGSRTFTPVEGLEDGRWETDIARSMLKKIESSPDVERNADSIRHDSLRAHYAAMEASMDHEKGLKGVESMDIWTAVFKPS
jgi:hypothetical protein